MLYLLNINTISQWLFPRLFAGGENELWLGETEGLPAGVYVVVRGARRVDAPTWDVVADAREARLATFERDIRLLTPTACEPALAHDAMVDCRQ
jgi:hypothetical protein